MLSTAEFHQSNVLKVTWKQRVNAKCSFFKD